MKKAILIVLIVAMIPSLCLAKDTEGIFSVEGTLWSMCAIEIEFPSYAPPSFGINCEWELGFYQGKVHFVKIKGTDCTDWIPSNEISFNDLPGVSIAFYIGYSYFFLVSMQPIGLGMFSWIYYTEWVGCQHSCVYKDFVFRVGIMYKINDNWIPPSD